MMTLSPNEMKRYARHLAIPAFGQEGQQKLKQSSVLIVGAGGLGSPLLLYLAAAGIGHIGIVDFDRIESSNLQRQVLYTEEDIGQYKAETAARKIRLLNPYIEVSTHIVSLNAQNALEILAPYDIIVDGTDNFPTRYLVNDACVLLDKVNVYGSIYRFEGQVSVFNALQDDGSRSPNYRDLFPSPPPPELVPNCAEGGVLGVLPGIIGSLQANEVIKIISGVGETLAGQLYIFDAATMISRKIRIPKRNTYQIKELIDYEQFCNPSAHQPVNEISVEELARWRAEGRELQLVDVREPHEHQMGNLGGRLIPVKKIEQLSGHIQGEQPTVLYCRTGRRSERAAQKLEALGYQNVYSLKGGLKAWAETIDPSLTVL
jgi:adenylyltransferase/sulfurtransferase